MVRRDTIQVGEDLDCQEKSPPSSPRQAHPQYRRLLRAQPQRLQAAGGNPAKHPRQLPAAKDYLRHLCLDKGYDFEEVRHILHAYGLVAHIRSRGEEAQAKKKKRGEKARRWVVERTHSWFNRFRSILTRWSKKAKNYLAMLYFVCGLISYRAAGLFG